jgi:phospholipase C
MAPAFAELRTPAALSRVVEMDAFYNDLSKGTLPQYSLIQPRMATSKNGTSNWQHPDNSVAAGEQLLSQVYAALRASQYWQDTALIITYDEHGGFADHVPPPHVGIPSPNSILGDNGFDFTRLGVRVPTVVVSPYVARNSVVHAPSGAQKPAPTSQWDATSIIATTNRLFGIYDNLTARDAWAGVFTGLFDGALRTDCPMTMPAPRLPPAAAFDIEMLTSLNDHHLDSLNLLCHLSDHAHALCARHADARATQRLVAELRASGAPADDSADWHFAGAYPHLVVPAARRLQQQHFEGISKALFGAYKAALGVAAA